MMRRLLSLILIVMVAFAMVACGGKENSEDTGMPDEKNTAEDSGSKDADGDDEMSDESTGNTEDDATQSKQMFEYEGMKVTLTSTELDETEGLFVYFDYENGSDKGYDVYLKYIIVNGIQVESERFIHHAYRQTTDSDYEQIRMDVLQTLGIDEIETCSVVFKLTELDADIDEEIYHTDMIYVYGDESTPAQVVEGTELLNENGIRIVVVSVYEDSLGPRLQLCVENNNDRDVDFARVDGSTLANGIGVSDTMYGEVAANAKLIFNYYIQGSSRKKAGVETLEALKTLEWTIDVCYRDYKDTSDMVLIDKTFSAAFENGEIVEN